MMGFCCCRWLLCGSSSIMHIRAAAGAFVACMLLDANETCTKEKSRKETIHNYTLSLSLALDVHGVCIVCEE